MKNRINCFNDKAKWLRKGVVYHRGKHDRNIRENTIEAIKGAIKDGLAVEIDVRLSKDKKVVLSHDDSLKRVFGIDKNISECNYEEICRLSKNEIPLLRDVLDLVDDKIGLMIEIKSCKVKGIAEAVYNILKNYRGRFVIVSFNVFILNYFRRKDPSIIRGQLAYNYKNKRYNWLFRFILSRMMLNFISKPHFISYGINDCNAKLLAKYRQKGYFIIGWTYRDNRNKEALLEIYDNMIVEEMDIREF